MFKYVGAKGYKLTPENYYSKEANEHFCSIHTFLNWYGTPYKEGCGGYMLDRLENPQEPSDAMLIGSYLDAYYDGTLEDFKATNPQLFKKDGSLLVKYEVAERMIARCEKDSLFKKYMTGEKQKIFTGNFGGIDWKIKTDNLIVKNGEIVGLVDLKTTSEIHPKNNGINFIDNFGYTFQMALYQKILKQNIGKYVPCYICAVSKEEYPETIVAYIPDEELDNCRRIILENSDNFLKVLTGEEKPELCGTCDYCKSIRENKEVINYKNL